MHLSRRGRLAGALALSVVVASGCQAFLDFGATTANDGGSASDASNESDGVGADGPADASNADGCTEVQSSANCGACGHDCLGGICEAGTCKPFVVTDQATSPGNIALDVDNIYWARWPQPGAGDAGRIERVPRDGGAVTALTSEIPSEKLVLDGPYVYFTIGWGGVKRVQKDAAAATPEGFYPESNYVVSDFVLTPSYIYEARRGVTGIVYRRLKPQDTAEAKLFLDNLTYVESLVVRDDVVYAGEIKVGLQPYITAGDGGPGEVVAAAAVQRMVADDQNLYFTNAASDSVFRVAQSARDAGGGVPVAKGRALAGEGALAIDQTFLYWVTPQDPGYVLRARKDADGGPAEVIASDVRIPLGIAVDDKTICWSESATGKIWCVAK